MTSWGPHGPPGDIWYPYAVFNSQSATSLHLAYARLHSSERTRCILHVSALQATVHVHLPVCSYHIATACLQVLIEAGAEIEALDTYGYTPLHRMASNNLAVGAEALLAAGADPNRPTEKPYTGDTPLSIARSSGARDVVEVLLRYGAKGRK